ncbi:MAG: hypothetical protein IJE59_02545 [Clostridia bacterium]|nr:hypothetical protein [Clostridia bacterium]
MRSIIERLENRIQNTAGLTVVEKRDDGFAYSIALQKDGENYVVYTTKGIHHFKKECCLIFMKVSEHLPFASITPTFNTDFISPYTRAVFSKGIRIGNQLYGLAVDELPIFQLAS